jgi:secondary thiamine-phosphate synthase enzyme
MHYRSEFRVVTPGRSLTNISNLVQNEVNDSTLREGLVTLFLHHTSASLILCENADPDVLGDMERFFRRLVPDGDPLYRHTAEGPDDMPAHVRSVLTQNSISIPLFEGRCDLGVWQGLFLWEHRTAAHERRVTVTITG